MGEVTMSMGELLAQGGVTMLPIYACSIFGLAVFLRKWDEFRRARLLDLGWFDKALERLKAGDFDGVQNACATSPHPGTEVLRAAAQALQERPERAESEARRVGSLQLQRLEKNLTVLSLLAQIAPLLGLLGTVLGMVDLFMNLQGQGTGGLEVSALSSGIWKALLTTAAGLGVAVPALASFTYLSSRADALRLQLSDMIQRTLYAAPGQRG